jgi:hypothetical protein
MKPITSHHAKRSLSQICNAANPQHENMRDPAMSASSDHLPRAEESQKPVRIPVTRSATSQEFPWALWVIVG